MQALVKRVSKNWEIVHEYFQKRSTMSENKLSMQRLNVAGALHNLNGILRYANVLNGQVNIIFS